jgi:hypothetical protein
MCALRRVDADRAGPAALGILVPPGRRTVLILRPRALAFDLVALRQPEGSTFRELAPDEAAGAARELWQGLEGWSRGNAAGRILVTGVLGADGFDLRVRVGGQTLLACPRLPGQPYAPLLFCGADSARAVADRLRAVLCPAPGAEQEVYLNTRHFDR